MPITHTCADRRADALTPNYRCCSNLIQALFMTICILIGGQRQQQVAPQLPTGNIANECLSFLQQPLQRLYLTQTHLPFSSDCIHQVLDTTYRGNKSSGPSRVPTQMIKHLLSRNDGNLARLFHRVTREGIPESWNTPKLIPVYKKGDKAVAANYRPVSILGPLAKLFVACLNGELEL